MCVLILVSRQKPLVINHGHQSFYLFSHLPYPDIGRIQITVGSSVNTTLTAVTTSIYDGNATPQLDTRYLSRCLFV